jgi:uncharacterized protein YggU (UPF0235/DUF167 family)
MTKGPNRAPGGASQRLVKVIQVKVKPRARISTLDQAADGSFVAWLRSAPVDGRGNAELIDLIARRYGCSKALVSIKSGASSRTKWVAIQLP